MGEFELLARIRERLPPQGERVLVGPGDDAAVTAPGPLSVTSVDAIVEGVHFRRPQAPLRSIGHKALAAALSDLAAMGAEPGEAYMIIGVPEDLDEDGCLELLDGAIAVATENGVSLAGGDVTRSPVLSVSVTAVGHATSREALVTRSGARPGDALVLTGEIGGAAAGLLLLENDELAAAVAEPIRAVAVSRQLEPRPRLEAGRALAAAGATAMIDVSDGLGADAGHLAASAGLRIDASAVPVDEAAAAVAGPAGVDPVELAVSGGEDYELLAALPPERLAEAEAAVGKSGSRLTRIGEVVAGAGAEISLPGGRLLAPGGYDQLS